MDRCPNVQVSKGRWPKRGLKDHDKRQDMELCPWSRGRAPQGGAGAYCALRRVVRETLGRQAGLRQARAGLQGQGDQMDSLYHRGIHDVRAPTIQVQPGERWTKWGGGVSDVYRGAGGHRSPSMGGPSRLWHRGCSAHGWDPASVESWTEGNHMCCLFLQGLDTSQACGGLAQEAGGHIGCNTPNCSQALGQRFLPQTDPSAGPWALAEPLPGTAPCVLRADASPQVSSLS